MQKNGGETNAVSNPTTVNTVNASCTEICGNKNTSKSCAKILPVNVYHKDNPENIVQMYAVIDDQSNRSLASPEFFNLFNIKEKPENYTLSTCSGRIVTSGKRAKGFIIESIHRQVRLELPVLIECEYIPNNRAEIPTPEVVMHFPHLKDLAGNIQAINNSMNIILLIVRDLTEAHHVLDQRLGPPRAPYAQQLKLGWVVIGETCLDNQHATPDLSVKKTFILPTGQPTTLTPCENKFGVRESNPASLNAMNKAVDIPEYDIFTKTKDDDKPGMS